MHFTFSILALFNFSEPIGSGWQLVRHVPPGETWHRATDSLLGTDMYGTYVSDLKAESAFSVKFEDTIFNEFLFATGDMSVWLRAPRSSVYGTYTNDPRVVTASSGHDGAYKATWTNRGSNSTADPLIAALDGKFKSVENDLYSGQLLYAENSYKENTKLLEGHSGANVFIRFKPGERALVEWYSSRYMSPTYLLVCLLFLSLNFSLCLLQYFHLVPAIDCQLVYSFVLLFPVRVFMYVCSTVCSPVLSLSRFFVFA